MKEKYEHTKTNVRLACEFIKKLAGIALAIGIAFAGVYTTYKGVQATQPILHYAFIVAGFCAIVDSIYAIWTVLMKEPKNSNFKAPGRN